VLIRDTIYEEGNIVNDTVQKLFKNHAGWRLTSELLTRHGGNPSRGADLNLRPPDSKFGTLTTEPCHLLHV